MNFVPTPLKTYISSQASTHLNPYHTPHLFLSLPSATQQTFQPAPNSDFFSHASSENYIFQFTILPPSPTVYSDNASTPARITHSNANASAKSKYTIPSTTAFCILTLALSSAGYLLPTSKFNMEPKLYLPLHPNPCTFDISFILDPALPPIINHTYMHAHSLLLAPTSPSVALHNDLLSTPTPQYFKNIISQR